jgi:FkbM family methyltransferase
MALVNFIQSVRSHSPGLLRSAKSLIDPWRQAANPLIPAIKKFHGRRVFVHPRFLTNNLDQYEPHVLNWLAGLIHPGDCVLDIGANVGLVSLLMANRTGKGGSVFAFEPSPANLRLLDYHKRKNRLTQLHIEPAAVSDKHGETISFFLINDGDNPSNSLVFSNDNIANMDAEAYACRREVTVPTVTVDAFCGARSLKPSVIKLDVEGAELLVLRGASRILSEVRPHVVLAVHPWWLPDGQTAADIVTFLHAHGYSIHDHSGHEAAILQYDEYLCSPRQKGHK